MEGLEVAEVDFSFVAGRGRLDAENMQKSALLYERQLRQRNLVRLETIADVSDGNHLSIASEFSDSVGVRYLRGQDVSGEMILDDRNAVFIPDSEYAKLSRSHII